MACRTYDIVLDCGCMVSSDGGGGLMPCYSDACKFDEWMKTPEYQEHMKEVIERNK